MLTVLGMLMGLALGFVAGWFAIEALGEDRGPASYIVPMLTGFIVTLVGCLVFVSLLT